jgi:diguanylate cyclase
VLIVVIGVFIGIWMTRGRILAERAHRMEAERAHQMIAGLLQWANAVKGDVHHYSDHMADLSRQLQQSEQAAKEDGEDNPPAGAVTDDLLTEMEHSNQQLQQRLDATEAAYDEQSGQLESYLSQAHTDPLTGLPNRRAFDEELARRYSEFNRKGTPLTVMLFDIDQFKALNDEFGHLTGDDVLVRTAGDLNQCVRDIDTVARFGGEEFALILPDTPLRDALLPAERARPAVAMDVVEYDGREGDLNIWLRADEQEAP